MEETVSKSKDEERRLIYFAYHQEYIEIVVNRLVYDDNKENCIDEIYKNFQKSIIRTDQKGVIGMTNIFRSDFGPYKDLENARCETFRVSTERKQLNKKILLNVMKDYYGQYIVTLEGHAYSMKPFERTGEVDMQFVNDFLTASKELEDFYVNR